MCSCFGKILERIVNDQLLRHLEKVRPLSSSQYGGRSATLNLLACDAEIYKYLNQNKPFDVITFDFQRAFDKVPHVLLLAEMSKLCLHPRSLDWFASFFSERTQKVELPGAVSSVVSVASGVVQGSILGSTCFCFFIDPLLQKISSILGSSSFAYADDIKFVTGTSAVDHIRSQLAVDVLHDWSISHYMPISVEKSLVLHSGDKNPHNVYVFGNVDLPCSSQMKDLGVIRSVSSHYRDHIDKLVADCWRLSGAIYHVFRSHDSSLLWTAFQIYVKSKIMYASPVWSPLLKCEVAELESVQRRFTKWLPGLHQLSYEQRLHHLNALSLEHSREFTDLLLIHRCLHGSMNITLADIGLSLSTNNDRSGKVRLTHDCPRTRQSEAMFGPRATSEWNKLPSGISSINSLSSFKTLLWKHFIN